MEELRDERRVVTVVFADLVGSTALAERLDPEEVRLVVGEAVARMVRAVEAYGGTVKDLAGDGCLALFGAPVAHEDDPERAILAGLRIAREIDDYGREVARSWGVAELRARVGVATGPVVVGMVGAGSRTEYGAFGDTVNVAARLQAAAEPGNVLVLESTQRLISERFEWSAARELELKGKAEPVTAYDVTAPVARGADPRAAGSHTPLVGREREMAQLADVAAGLAAGSGGIVMLAGEPGIGKSRLVTELRERGLPSAAGAEPQWIVGRCLSYGEALPYWPFRDLLRDWLGVAGDEPELRTRVALRRRIDTLYGEHALDAYPYLAALLDLEIEPDARARLAEQSPEARQYRTWEVIGELLTRLASDAPLVVVVEDLHWADPTSLALLERIVAVADEAAVLLILTHRAERDHASWRLRELAMRDFGHRTLVIDLPVLPGKAERELLAGLVGRDTLPEPVSLRLLRTAEGNPFFLEELVRSMADAGALVRDGEDWRFEHDVDIDVPPTVGMVINARLDRLAAPVQHVVRAAAVLGRRFDLPLLEAVAGSGDGVADSLRVLQRLDLVREARRWPSAEYQFKHVLIQEAAYATLVEAERTQLHRRAADWLEERSAGDPAEVAGLLARHWLAARDEDRAARYLALAGDRARAEHALDESIGYYRALLPVLERRGEKPEMALVLFKLALALHFDLRFGEANAAYQEAFALWQPPAPAGPPTATLVVGTDSPPVQVDPPRSHYLQDIQLQMALFDRLVEAWPERAIVPSLAEHWTIADDGLRYVFRLRGDAYWSDGQPITAGDVEYAVKRNLDRERPGASVAIYFVVDGAQDYYLGRHDDLASVGVRAVDDRHVEFRLSAPAPYFMNVVNRPDAGPQPRHAIERHGDDWTNPQHHVVSGAFRRTEWGPERIVLDRRADSHGPRRGNVARVEMHAVADRQMAALYRADAVDVLLSRAPYDESELLEVAAADAVATPAAYAVYAAFNGATPIGADRHIRLALAHALDRESIAAVLPAYAIVARGGLVPPALHGHTPDIVPRFDPAAARAHLERATNPHPRLQLLAVADHLLGALAQQMALAWRGVLGLDVELIEMTVDDYRAGRDAKIAALPVVLNGWFPGYPDPEYFLRLLLHSAAKDNVGGYSNPAFDGLIEQARIERDVRRRLELFHEADRMAVTEEAAVIPLLYSRNDIYVKPWVEGWWEYGKSWSSFADLIVGDTSPRVSG